MKNYFCLFALIVHSCVVFSQQNTWIRINQLGYLPSDVKVAVLVSKDSTLDISEFQLCDALTEQVIFTSQKVKKFGAWAAFSTAFRLNFSDFNQQGSYFIKSNNVKSPTFRIAADVYNGTADFLLRYMRQQRCGFNPSLNDSCHTAGGYVVYGDSTNERYKNFAPFPIFGGWHDASDYLQYVTTTATATFQLLFAYEQNPSVFQDHFQANGLAGKNGIPDILDEAKWGLDWLVRLNPEPNVFFNQVCDDRDHRGMRMPNLDTFSYDLVGNRARPVYRITGEPQGLGKYKNRTVGVSSSAAKFSSAFAAGARVLKSYYPDFAENLMQKAQNAYDFAQSDTGTCQTAPKGAPYFYEEDNWVDDMELAATQLFETHKKEDFQQAAKNFAQAEPVTPWMGRDTARHYQFFPFLNLGHYFLAKNQPSESYLLKNGIEKIVNRGKSNPFQIGTPFIWCSNNYVSAAITQMKLYQNLTGDTQFQEAEAAHRDWLLGCNPWGTSMIYGLPNAQIGANTEGVSPRDPHSAFTHNAHIPIDGGLVDGPIYGSIFGKLIGITLYQPDEFKEFQSPLVVFHDDYGDYSTDEPTMDGTASLAYYFSAKQTQNKTPQYSIEKMGAVSRLATDAKRIHLTFTGHDFAEGGESILKVLKKQKVKASFFFTGDFLRKNAALVQKIKRQGHFIGAHSDKHLLYCDWSKRDSLLVTKQAFRQDLKANFDELARLGIEKTSASVFMPPYEWYNDSIALWTKQAGLTLINFTSGTSSNADYTTPDMKNYKSSQAIYDRILQFEQTEKQGLNGFILLLHIGVGDKRKDKFWTYLNPLLTELKKRGYAFDRF